MRTAAALILGLVIGIASAAHTVWAEDCPNHPDALGTSRTLIIDPAYYPKVGAMAHRLLCLSLKKKSS